MTFKLPIYGKDMFRHGLWLALFAALLSVTTIRIYDNGLSALNLTFCLVTLFAMTRVFIAFGGSERRLTTVLRALANLDPSLGLAKDSALQQEFASVREQIQRSKAELRAREQFLRTMLMHLDTGIVVIDDSSRVIHKNPAADRLLGPLPDHVGDVVWGTLGDYLREAKKVSRTIMPWQKGEHQDTLSVHISLSRSHARRVKIVSIQSIRQALEAKEQLAYKRLTRVLSHEVANSIMPLALLATTAKTMLPHNLAFECQEAKNDIEEALRTLATRAENLDHFINRFSEMSRLPPPRLKKTNLRSLLDSVFALFNDSFDSNHINADLYIDPGAQYWVMADPAQIEQVLVNIITNAVEILKDVPDKRISATIGLNEHDQLIVDVLDSGTGIDIHARDHIFVPFFTTKPEGSGIGLSLARQIMVGHGGDLLYVDNQENPDQLQGAHFRLVFG